MVKSRDLGQKKNLKFNAIDLLEGKPLVNCFLSFTCPLCGGKMLTAYLIGRVCYCKECKKVFELIMKPSNIEYQQVIKDGWIKE